MPGCTSTFFQATPGNSELCRRCVTYAIASSCLPAPFSMTTPQLSSSFSSFRLTAMATPLKKDSGLYTECAKAGRMEPKTIGLPDTVDRVVGCVSRAPGRGRDGLVEVAVSGQPDKALGLIFKRQRRG